MSPKGQSQEGGRSLGASLQALLGALFVMMMILAAVAMVDSAERARYVQAKQSDAALYAGVVRAKLESALQKRLRITYGLAAFARAQFDDLPGDFYKFAESLMQSGVVGLRSLQLAPNAVVRYVYPYRTNEKIMGHDLLADPNRRDAVIRSIEQRLFLVAGPVDLIQGGRGLIARLPIYRQMPGGEVFWGFATVVMDLDPLLAEAEVEDPTSGYVVAVRGVDGLGELGRPFFGDATLFDRDPTLAWAALPAGNWQIAVLPRDGWPNAAPSSRNTWAIGLLLALMGGALTLVVLLAPEALRREVGRATQALREREEQFRRVAESATDAIVSADQNGNLVFWNRAAERIFGYTADQILGRPVGLLMPDRFRGQAESAFGRAAAMSGSWNSGRTLEGVARHRDGHEFPVELSSAEWSSGGANYFTAIIRDVTERKRAEREQALLQERFHQAQRLEAIGTLASGAAHEFNNILNSIMANADTAAMQLAPEDPAAGAVAQVQDGAWRAAEIVRQLLVFSERAAEAVTPVPVAEVVIETVASLRESSPPWIEFAFDHASGRDGLAMCEPGALRQMLTSLCVNAMQALNGGAGRVTVGLDRLDGPQCHIPDSGDDEFAAMEIGQVERWPAVAITVSDTGCGMTRAVLSRAFEPFFTTRPVGAGSGLGLSVVHGIVQRCGGAISVVSKPGSGSTFTVLLPAYQTAATAVAASA